MLIHSEKLLRKRRTKTPIGKIVYAFCAISSIALFGLVAWTGELSILPNEYSTSLLLFNPSTRTTTSRDVRFLKENMIDQPWHIESPNNNNNGLDLKIEKRSYYNPVSCPKFVKRAEDGKIVNFTDPNNGELISRETITDPKFHIALHNNSYDIVRWSIMIYGFYYEVKLSELFVQILNESTSENTRVLDVGGNIGFYSLLSASVGGVTVDAFEPNAVNIFRFCQSTQLNNWTSEFDNDDTSPFVTSDTANLRSLDENEPNHEKNTPSHVNIYRYGVGEKMGSFKLIVPHSNPGAGRIAKVLPNHTTAFTGNADAGTVKEVSYTATDVPVLTLDSFARTNGWLDNFSNENGQIRDADGSTLPDIAILKIDVEGAEGNVIRGAKELLASGLVRNIFMEISVRNREEKRDIVPAMNIIIESGYKLARIGGFKGPNREHKWEHDENLSQNIVDACFKEKNKQLNLWWTKSALSQ